MELSENYNTGYTGAGLIVPYFKIIDTGTTYLIFEGAHGRDRFNEIEIPKNSKEGVLCADYLGTQEPQSSNVLIELLNIVSKHIKVEGIDAYLHYWNTFTDEEKLNHGFCANPHVEALKNWFNIALSHYVDNTAFLNDEEKRRDVEYWKFKTLQKVQEYLKSSIKNGTCSKSSITRHEASQLVEFMKWIESEQKIFESFELLFEDAYKHGV